MLQPGDRVVIKSERRVTTLVRRLGPSIPGGWIVDPPVAGLSMWNEDDMRPNILMSRKRGTRVDLVDADGDVADTMIVVDGDV